MLLVDSPKLVQYFLEDVRKHGLFLFVCCRHQHYPLLLHFLQHFFGNFNQFGERNPVVDNLQMLLYSANQVLKFRLVSHVATQVFQQLYQRLLELLANCSILLGLHVDILIDGYSQTVDLTDVMDIPYYLHDLREHDYFLYDSFYDFILSLNELVGVGQLLDDCFASHFNYLILNRRSDLDLGADLLNDF